MEPLTVQVTQAHIDEFERRWNALESGGDYDETRDRATAIALQEALTARGVTAEVNVYIYDEEPSRIFIGDYFCIAPSVVEDHEYNARGPYEFTLFNGEEAWATHVPLDAIEKRLCNGGPRVYSAYVTSDNALFDDHDSACANAQAIADEGGDANLDLLTLLEPQDAGVGPGGSTSLTPDTYQTVDEAVEVIEAAVRLADAPGHTSSEQGWKELVLMRDDVSPEVFERGIRAYTDDESAVQHLINETERRAHAHILTVLDSVPGRRAASP